MAVDLSRSCPKEPHAVLRDPTRSVAASVRCCLSLDEDSEAGTARGAVDASTRATPWLARRRFRGVCRISLVGSVPPDALARGPCSLGCGEVGTVVSSMGNGGCLKPATPEQGELLLALCYKASHERLTVTVLEARGLTAPPEMGPPETPLDTQVKVSFLMENKPVKSKKTSVCKRNCEPKFMESFGFKVSPAGLSAASVILKLSCLAPPHKDRCLGRVVLGSFMFARGQAQQHWTDAMAAAPKQIHRWHKLS
ncbi:synaptotagmin-15 [Ixodes scapularis]